MRHTAKHFKQKHNNPDAAPDNAGTLKGPVREALEWLLSIVIALAIVFVIHTFIGQLVRVDGSSMEPTLYTNQRMVITKFSYMIGQPERGDIVVTHFPNDRKNYVKRIMGLPGDQIAVIDGTLYINGDAIDEPYIREPMMRDFSEITISTDSYFVMGDNRNDSRDSRSVGELHESLIVGKVQFVVWPLNHLKKIVHYDYDVLAAH